MPKAILIFGYSGSGKSYLSNKLYLSHKYKTLCPHGWVKRHLETVYDIEKGALETKDGKKYKPPGSLQTMEEILHNLYFFWQQVDPWHTARGFRKVLENAAKTKCNLSINGIRNPHDIQVIKQVLEAYNYDVYKIWLSSHCSVANPADAAQPSLFRNAIGVQLEDCFNELKPNSFDSLVRELATCG